MYGFLLIWYSHFFLLRIEFNSSPSSADNVCGLNGSRHLRYPPPPPVMIPNNWVYHSLFRSVSVCSFCFAASYVPPCVLCIPVYPLSVVALVDVVVVRRISGGGGKTGLPRLSFLDLMGSLLTCQAYRASAHFPKHAAETLVACTLMQFGENGCS